MYWIHHHRRHHCGADIILVPKSGSSLRSKYSTRPPPLKQFPCSLPYMVLWYLCIPDPTHCSLVNQSLEPWLEVAHKPWLEETFELTMIHVGVHEMWSHGSVWEGKDFQEWGTRNKMIRALLRILYLCSSLWVTLFMPQNFPERCYSMCPAIGSAGWENSTAPGEWSGKDSGGGGERRSQGWLLLYKEAFAGEPALGLCRRSTEHCSQVWTYKTALYWYWPI